MTLIQSRFPGLRETIRPTTFIEASRLGRRLGVRLTLATETFQHTGSFKFRAAYNVAARVAPNRIITASSGNFGQAMAYACRLLGKSCIVVMPSTSAKVKIEAVKEFGGEVDLVEVAAKSRKARVEELACAHPDAYVASAYDDPLVIEGNASLGAELAGYPAKFDAVIAPVGGGGLTSGVIKGLRDSGAQLRIFGAEPLLGNDAARSLRAGHIVANRGEPQTIADGARTVSVGEHNWAWLRDGLAGIVEVPEDKIREGVRLLFSLANLKAEPTGSLGIGALLTQPESFQDASVCCVISGGNVDPAVFAGILSA
ncbi:MAG: threonine/serine dehydratase [Verrucomicrobia bacterium]|nr:threonine/serine dehydratase [Verrucomicrobiota bacterium]